MRIFVFFSMILICNQKMKQQIMNTPKENIFKEFPVPEISDEQVLFKIHRIGICEVIFMYTMACIHLHHIQ